MNEISFNGKKYTRNGSAWVREDGAVLGQAYCDYAQMELAPAVGRYAVDLACAGDNPALKSKTLAQVSRSFGNSVLNAVLTLAGDLRSSGAVMAAA